MVVKPFSSGGEHWDFGINVFHRRPKGHWNETWQYRPPNFHGRENILRDEKGRYVDHIPGEHYLGDHRMRFVETMSWIA